MSIKLARRLAFTALAFGLTVMAAPTAKAQGLPGGSYRQTCNQVHWAGTTLVAECRRRDGRMTGTGLPNANRCVGDIGNNNGQLQCNYAGGQASSPAQQPSRSQAPSQGYAPNPEPGYGAPGYGAPGGGSPGYGAPGGGSPGYGAPGYGSPGYGPR